MRLLLLKTICVCVGGGGGGGVEDQMLKIRHLHRLTDADLLNWSPTATAGAAVAVEGGIMRPNDPNILAQCHSRTGTHMS